MSPKEKELLHFVENYWNERYCAPTYKEIAENLGVKSVGWVHSLVNSLVSKGILVKKGHRTLRPAHLTQKSLDKKL
jgi:SOS-response transcriptional repressor LexA|tara:strand:- start:153 stop:380 length:228 start_codon:yes stop_codon:yes gene_type:complete